ncbi:hypothetical protein GGR53DRAFT_504466 [Hypoxylon sp. FL1150]|nr:hypothetical protein GGR53DRAFT_504466 [Hypoxylon sp. FL1150]
MEDIDNLEDDDSDDQEKYRTYRVMPKKEGEAEAEVYESEERDPRKIETRELIRMDTRLGLDAKTVLLLVTQIPEGCWTDYDTIRRHIYKHWKTRRGLHKLAQKFDRIPRALANNRLGNDRVPCHRVVGYRQLYPMICVAGHVHDQDLLRAEGVRFGADDVPLGEPWDGFTGCPRVSLDCTTTG